MARLQVTALWLIALLLAAHLALEHVRPFIVLASRREPYLEAARKCHEAVSNYRAVRVIVEEHSWPVPSHLHKSAMVGLMDCYERECLRLSMLSGGVNVTEIERLDLEARNESSASLDYFVQGLGEQR